MRISLVRFTVNPPFGGCRIWVSYLYICYLIGVWARRVNATRKRVILLVLLGIFGHGDISFGSFGVHAEFTDHGKVKQCCA